jgi:hypothetical protein
VRAPDELATVIEKLRRLEVMVEALLNLHGLEPDERGMVTQSGADPRPLPLAMGPG